MSETAILPPDGFPLPADNPLAEAHWLISRYFDKHSEPVYTNRSAVWEAEARSFVPVDPSARFDLMFASVERLAWLMEQASADEDGYRASVSGRHRNCPGMLLVLMSVLGETSLLFRPSDAESLALCVADLFQGDMTEAARQMPGYRMRTYQFPVETFVRQWEQFCQGYTLTPMTRDALAYISRALKTYTLDRINRNKFAVRIDRLLDKYLWPDADEPWADAVLHDLAGMDVKARTLGVPSAPIARLPTAQGQAISG